MSDDRDDATLSRDIAREARQLLLQMRREFYDEHAAPVDKQTANRLRDAADARSNDLILERLHAARPQDSVLSEEAKDDDSRLRSERVWIVDPLDGTWEYGQNRQDFAVHIALWSNGELRACTVDLPAQDITRSVLDAVTPIALPTDRPLRLVASRSRPPATLESTREALERIVRQAKSTISVWRSSTSGRWEPKSVRSSLAGPTPTCMTPASTSGTSRRRTGSPRTTGCAPPTSTAHRSPSTTCRPTSRISSSRTPSCIPTYDKPWRRHPDREPARHRRTPAGLPAGEPAG